MFSFHYASDISGYKYYFKVKGSSKSSSDTICWENPWMRGVTNNFWKIYEKYRYKIWNTPMHTFQELFWNS